MKIEAEKVISNVNTARAFSIYNFEILLIWQTEKRTESGEQTR